MTRIVSGTAGGRRLRVPPQGTRPTSQRVREALFNALEASGAVDGARVLDLYAGAGALGLEALSRGAAEVVFVESQREAVRTLRANREAVGLGGVIRQETVENVVNAPPPRSFDVVLADPPYQAGALGPVLERLASGPWIEPGGVVVIERAHRDAQPDWPEAFQVLRVKRYGDTALHWARYDPAT